MKIFVSYSRGDATDFTTYIHKSLNDFGHSVLIDTQNILASDPWSHVIEEKILQCDIFFVILTPRSLRSTAVEKEVLHAQRKERKIIPCIYRDVNNEQMRWGLDQTQGIEFKDEYELDRKVEKEINRISNPILKSDPVKIYPLQDPYWFYESINICRALLGSDLEPESTGYKTLSFQLHCQDENGDDIGSTLIEIRGMRIQGTVWDGNSKGIGKMEKRSDIQAKNDN